MPTVRDACRTTAPYSCAAPVALQLAARLRSRVIGHTWDGRNYDAGYGPLHVVHCVLHVACCMLLVACLHAATGAIRFRMPARGDAFVGMAVADAAVGRKASVTLRAHTVLVTALLLCWSPRLRHTHRCAAVSACSYNSSRPSAPRRRCWRM